MGGILSEEEMEESRARKERMGVVEGEDLDDVGIMGVD
jgi:hypothetical protein